MIDWSIRFGDVLVVISLCGSAVIFAFKVGRFTESVKTMQQKMEELKDVAKTIGDVLIQIAIQKREIEHIQEDIVEMKHWRGFINPDGEWPRK